LEKRILQNSPFVKSRFGLAHCFVNSISLTYKNMKHLSPLILIASFLVGCLAVSCNKSEVIPSPSLSDTIEVDTIAHDYVMADTNMVLVKGGKFMMGTNNGAFDEKPVHEVELSDFFISKYEVTVAFHTKILKGRIISDRKPKEFSTWLEVQQFIDTLRKVTGLNYRLPTEAEWEYAARGGRLSKGYLYSGSNDIKEVGWTYLNGIKVFPVGLLKANELGLYDMTGNTLEWCSDWYDPGYYSVGSGKNPLGPSSGLYHVLRGGFTAHTPNESRVFTRHSEQEVLRFHSFSTPHLILIGLRLVIGK
jgi:formylglycine-generating enzyme required for sulfatase activity